MAYHVKTNGYAGLAKDGTSKYYVDVMVDTAADIPNPAEHPEWEVGSELMVLENGGSKYQLSNAREWVSVNFNSGGGGDSKAQEMLDLLVAGGLERIESDVETIRADAFAQHPTLKSAYFPNVKTVEAGAFRSCPLLESVYLPSAKVVKTTAFGGCPKLYRLDLPSVVKFEGIIFGGSAITTLILRSSTMCEATDPMAPGTPISGVNGEGYIYVPKAIIEQYRSASGWATHRNYFRAIEDYPEICG